MDDAGIIREIVEQYFRRRYQALSQKCGMGFESFCEGERMEDEERRCVKELEIARAKGLTYNEWELELNFITVRIRCRRAWVDVEENHRVVFAVTANTRSSMKGLMHRIKLIKRLGKWRIIDHRYKDELGTFLKSRKSILNLGFNVPDAIFAREGDSKSRIHAYDREAAVRYAHRWALGRNPRYYDFEDLGGDCTNFCSQVVHAGGCPMNERKWTGWYYHSLNNRSPSWTGVEFFYKFLINNRGVGPQGKEVLPSDLRPGDIIQLDFSYSSNYNHSLVVVSNPEPNDLNRILISCHTIDRDNYPLVFYNWRGIRFIHIAGYGK
ncbi:MAG: hypothetical protein HPY66_1376 [Firmicutes bacterium]|nr:hypothetical protein [Bacillota bacterium]